MLHPVFSNKLIVISYTLISVLLIGIDFAINYISIGVLPEVAVVNAIIYNIVLAGLGLSLWYPVFYIDKTKGEFKIISQFIIIGVVFILIWHLISSFLISFTEDTIVLKLKSQSGHYFVRIVAAALIFLLLLSIYYLLIYNHSIEEKNKAQLRLESLLKETELNYLKSQLNPHFLFNSLNSISSLTISNPESAREMINKLSEFLRYSLKDNEEVFLPLKDEVQNMKRYIDIEKVRFGDKLCFNAAISENDKHLLVPVLILQPIIENAVKHGVCNSLVPVHINLNTELLGDMLIVTVTNEYDAEEVSSKGEGIGLKNIKERLFRLYNQTGLLQVNADDNIFKVSVKFPQKCR